MQVNNLLISPVERPVETPALWQVFFIGQAA